MHRIVLDYQRDDEYSGDIVDTTPLRGNVVRYPRLRLLERDVKTDQVPVQILPTGRPTAPKPPPPQIVKTYRAPAPENTCPIDRYIPCRRECNFEAARYLLMKKPLDVIQKNQIDVFRQMQNLRVASQRKCMQKVLAQGVAIPGIAQSSILGGKKSSSSSACKMPGSLVGHSSVLLDSEFVEDGLWKSRPRKKPSIPATSELILNIPAFRPSNHNRCYLLDWNSQNVLAVGISDTVNFFKVGPIETNESKRIKDVAVCAMKWNGAGDKLALCTLASDVMLYDFSLDKFLWTVQCKCVAGENRRCLGRCVCWSRKDRYVVVGCRGLVSIYEASSGRVNYAFYAHNVAILTVTFSPDYRYLLTTARDTSVRIYTWPSLVLYLDINYYVSIQAIAWHPQECGLLCVGGGFWDGSLSLWNINKQDSVSFRRVMFHGCVKQLAWNGRSGELLVHWTYYRGREAFTVVPVLASLDRVVDYVPLRKDTHVCSLVWNHDHTKLAIQSKNDVCLWSFFGDDCKYWRNSRKGAGSEQRREGREQHIGEVRRYNIR